MRNANGTRYALLSTLLMVAVLLLAGCGGDNGGLSSEEMARIADAESAAAMAQADADAAQAEAAAAHEEAEAAEAAAAAAQAEAEKAIADAAAAAAEVEDIEIPEVDTSAQDAALDALETLVQQLDDRTATPPEAPEILGGKKSTASAADLAALAGVFAEELNEATVTYETPTPPVNLPGTGGMWVKATMMREPKPYVTTIKDDRDDYGDFLTHTFGKGKGTPVDLTGDLGSAKLKGLLEVNDVSLMGVSMKETDKVRVARTDARGVELGTISPGGGTPGAVTVLDHITTTTLRADGSKKVVTRIDNPAETIVRSVTTTYFDGNKIVEYNPVVDNAIEATSGIRENGTGAEGDIGAIVTLADGRMITYDLLPEVAATADTPLIPIRFPSTTPTLEAAGTPPQLPVADLAAAKRAYDGAGAAGGYMQAGHTLAGYGGWLEDSFFLVYTLTAGDQMAMKVFAGGREHDTKRVNGNLSGFGESATWKGLMAGHDKTGGKMVKGNAMITARVGEATLADAAATRVPDIVDVSLTNIITGDGKVVKRVADGIHWTNLDLTSGVFYKGDEILGTFYDGGNEVVGTFDKMNILGAFGAKEYEMMDDAMDMASQ